MESKDSSSYSFLHSTVDTVFLLLAVVQVGATATEICAWLDRKYYCQVLQSCTCFVASMSWLNQFRCLGLKRRTQDLPDSVLKIMIRVSVLLCTGGKLRTFWLKNIIKS